MYNEEPFVMYKTCINNKCYDGLPITIIKELEDNMSTVRKMHLIILILCASYWNGKNIFIKNYESIRDKKYLNCIHIWFTFVLFSFFTCLLGMHFSLSNIIEISFYFSKYIVSVQKRIVITFYI
jgi:hypothetical protein